MTGRTPFPARRTGQGFLLTPAALRVSGWTGPNRLHDRRQFFRDEDGGWDNTLLYP